MCVCDFHKMKEEKLNKRSNNKLFLRYQKNFISTRLAQNFQILLLGSQALWADNLSKILQNSWMYIWAILLKTGQNCDIEGKNS